jgi:hypothetical protein
LIRFKPLLLPLQSLLLVLWRRAAIHTMVATGTGPHRGTLPRAVLNSGMSEPMAVIREFPNEMEAMLAQSVLEANGIDAGLLRDNAGGMLPALQVLFPVRLIVTVRDAERAAAILDSSVDDGDEADGGAADADATGVDGNG